MGCSLGFRFLCLQVQLIPGKIRIPIRSPTRPRPRSPCHFPNQLPRWIRTRSPTLSQIPSLSLRPNRQSCQSH
ncbi:hypothetical protein CDD83_7168 [Cordyceps sp. RAO-2017]|nr:hypothetical protein CDD83_7168 [Cordyceps sp. RAO-2017]